MQKSLSIILVAVLMAIAPATLQAMDLSGTYDATGTNPDGSQYKGTCTITRISGDRYRFVWSVGNSYQGEGELQGTRISVDWGDEQPVIYDVLPDGTPDGTWAGGKATETLKPQGKGQW